MSGANPLPRDAAASDPAVLKRVATELAELRSIGLKLQDLFGAEIHSGRLNSAVLTDMQSVDFLVQHLQEISKFLNAYSDAIVDKHSDPVAAATGTVVLSDLARRLSQSKAAESAPPVASGEVELF